MTSKRVLVAPLDWGLGHATRCIPIVNLLIKFKCDVIIAGSGMSLALLQVEYPSLTFIELPAYNPAYSSRSTLVIKMLTQLPKFLKVIKKEHAVLENIVRDRNIDIVISDNRYGCWSSSAKSIFITHQLNILMPEGLKWLSTVVNFFNYKLIRKYNVCWVPDNDREKLTTELSTCDALNVKFIGTLSRFQKCLPSSVFKYKVIVVLSGPEPQRTLLEKILMNQLRLLNLPTLVVRGVLGKVSPQCGDRIEIVNFLNTQQLNNALCESEIVIARAGYSTIMDLAKLEKRAILIPTPGQTEQEHLASVLRRKSIAYSVDQNKINLQNDIAQAYNYNGFKTSYERQDSLNNIISELVK
jgi:uncharacterized protein (TIGR00661 family)